MTRRHRDDMVLRPAQAIRKDGPAARRAAEMRRQAKSKRKRKLLRRLAQRTKARALAKATPARLGRLGMMARLGVPGLVLGGAVIGAGVANRLITGRSTEHTKVLLNKAILGDLDDRARANRRVRDHFAQDRQTLLHINDHGFHRQLRRISDDLLPIQKRWEVGISRIQEDPHFEQLNTFDVIVDRIINFFRNAFASGEGQAKTRALTRALSEVV